VKCEQEWIRKFAVPLPPDDPSFRSEDDNSPTKHIEALDMYLAASKHLAFSEPFAAPTLWHTDLHQSNIFVSPTPPHDILSIIDWQNVSVAPLPTQVFFPKALRYKGKNFHPDPKVPVPPIPEDFHTRSPEEKVTLRREMVDAFMQSFHVVLMRGDPLRMASQGLPHTATIADPIYPMSQSWNLGLHVTRYWLARVQLSWSDILGPDAPPCPFNLSREEIDQVMKEYEWWARYRKAINELRDSMEMRQDGWVAVDRYREVKWSCWTLSWIWDPTEGVGPYPFQDGYTQL